MTIQYRHRWPSRGAASHSGSGFRDMRLIYNPQIWSSLNVVIERQYVLPHLFKRFKRMPVAYALHDL